MVAPDRVQSIGQIEMFDIQTVCLCETELFKIEVFDHSIVCKQIIYIRLNY